MRASERDAIIKETREKARYAVESISSDYSEEERDRAIMAIANMAALAVSAARGKKKAYRQDEMFHRKAVNEEILALLGRN